jgi:hypothetical protein
MWVPPSHCPPGASPPPPRASALTLRVDPQPLKLCTQHDTGLSHLDVQVSTLQQQHL